MQHIDRATARALTDAGYMPLSEYMAMFCDEAQASELLEAADAPAAADSHHARAWTIPAHFASPVGSSRYRIRLRDVPSVALPELKPARVPPGTSANGVVEPAFPPWTNAGLEQSPGRTYLIAWGAPSDRCPMDLDRAAYRALVDAGFMPLRDYVEMFGHTQDIAPPIAHEPDDESADAAIERRHEPARGRPRQRAVA